ncbi:MAG: SAM-dependent methyltransferase [Alphaproteobacteria bacterium]|nr:SAM-dependent methyltransferase [Alphaproteobacteria bacterium]
MVINPSKTKKPTLTLTDLLKQEISDVGPLTLERYMERALTDPTNGYYLTKKPIGSKGDFITAPEVSQLFGEMIALWFVDQVLRSPYAASKHLTLIECGPGRGTLIRDILRVFEKIPAFSMAIDLHFVEVNPDFRINLSVLEKKYPLTFHDDVKSLLSIDSTHPVLFIANEFLDVFPIQQFVYLKGTWHAINVTFDDEQARFQPTLQSSIASLPPEIKRESDFKQGDILEYSPQQFECLRIFEHILQKNGGFGLLIDYGYTHAPRKSSLQALKDHQKVDPFQNPGEADLTSLIDFGSLYDWCTHSSSLNTKLTSQGDFLEMLGIKTRAEILKKMSSQPQQQAIDEALHRLTHPSAMGRLFKVLTLTSLGNTIHAGD